MSALTPAQAALRLLVSMNTVLTPRRSPCVLCHAVMTIPSPHTKRVPASLSHATPQRIPVPHLTGGLRFRQFREGSSPTSGRIEFVILRTGHSPSIALHLASRRRSYRWVRAGERIPEEDFHLSVMAPLQAHPATRASREQEGHTIPNTNSGRVRRCLFSGSCDPPGAGRWPASPGRCSAAFSRQRRAIPRKKYDDLQRCSHSN